MILAIIGLITGIYTFARKVVKNEPLKGNLDSLFDKANIHLSTYKNQKPKLILDKLSKLSKKGFLYSLVVCMIILFFPKNIETELMKLISPVFGLCVVLNSSISWIQNHNKTFKEHFFNIHMVFLLFSPVLLHFFDLCTKSDIKISQIFYPLKTLMGNIDLVYFQIIWIIILIVFLYLGALIIALPVYLLIYCSIIITAYFIKIMEKYIDNHILDGIIGLVILSTVIYKVYIKIEI